MDTAEPDRAPVDGTPTTAPPAPVPEPAGTPAADPMTEVVRSKTKAERSPRDMAMSLLVLLVPIALLLCFYRVVLGGDEPVTVDPGPVLAQARSAAAFPVREPVGLGERWRVTSASFQQADGRRTLRIGYLTPDGAGVQLLQSDVPVERLIPAELGTGARARGPAPQAGTGWQRYTARPGERALVLLQPQVSTVVAGAAAEQELAALAAALR